MGIDKFRDGFIDQAFIADIGNDAIATDVDKITLHIDKSDETKMAQQYRIYDADGNEMDNPFLPYKHTFVKYNAKPATCEKDGSIEYYHCSVCGKDFKDSTGNVEVTDIVVKAEGHKYGTDGRCTVCGITDPNKTNSNNNNNNSSTNKSSGGCSLSLSGSMISLLFVLAVLFILKRKRSDQIRDREQTKKNRENGAFLFLKDFISLLNCMTKFVT